MKLRARGRAGSSSSGIRAGQGTNQNFGPTK